MDKLVFSYERYRTIIKLVKECGFKFLNYHEALENDQNEKKCISRHDVDICLERAVRLAEEDMRLGITSTFFVLLRTDMYNVASAMSIEMIERITAYGHEIGLHFDETAYDENVDIVKMIRKEAEILGEIINRKITTVSMHRPSKKTLDSNYEIPGIVNSYGDFFFKGYKYLSDSRFNWREDPEKTIVSGVFSCIHLLTHPIAYDDKEITVKDRIIGDINSQRRKRYDCWDENFTNINEFVEKDEII